jgi:hypothetical protein
MSLIENQIEKVEVMLDVKGGKATEVKNVLTTLIDCLTKDRY